MYRVKNLTAFAKQIGIQVAKDASFTQKELKSYITVRNIKNIIRQYANKNKGDNKLFVTNEAVAAICENIFDWLVGVDLAKLAASDKIDCYWDNEKNDMIFMRKDGSRNENDMA